MTVPDALLMIVPPAVTPTPPAPPLSAALMVASLLVPMALRVMPLPLIEPASSCRSPSAVAETAPPVEITADEVRPASESSVIAPLPLETVMPLPSVIRPTESSTIVPTPAVLALARRPSRPPEVSASPPEPATIAPLRLMSLPEFTVTRPAPLVVSEPAALLVTVPPALIASSPVPPLMAALTRMSLASPPVALSATPVPLTEPPFRARSPIAAIVTAPPVEMVAPDVTPAPLSIVMAPEPVETVIPLRSEIPVPLSRTIPVPAPVTLALTASAPEVSTDTPPPVLERVLAMVRPPTSTSEKLPPEVKPVAVAAEPIEPIALAGLASVVAPVELPVRTAAVIAALCVIAPPDTSVMMPLVPVRALMAILPPAVRLSADPPPTALVMVSGPVTLNVRPLAVKPARLVTTFEPDSVVAPTELPLRLAAVITPASWRMRPLETSETASPAPAVTPPVRISSPATPLVTRNVTLSAALTPPTLRLPFSVAMVSEPLGAAKEVMVRPPPVSVSEMSPPTVGNGASRIASRFCARSVRSSPRVTLV